jgi:preprotein translocase subunit SecE
MGVQVDKLEPRAELQPSPKIARPRFSTVGYLQELKNELRQVTWTSKNELVVFTKIVVGTTFAFGLGIYGVDLLIKGCLTGFKTLIHLIFG